MNITMLGTGNAMVTECYNTCFVLEDGDKHLLVDGGGGNTLLRQLKQAGFDWKDMREIFVTHKHVDHIMGVVWMIRMICQNMKQGQYDGEATIYGHEEVIRILKEMAEMLYPAKQTCFIGDRLHLVVVNDGEERELMGHKVTFFDIQSTKAKQYGFCMDMGNGGKLTCCGDEPYNECEKKYAENSKWLLHEAFCLYDQADVFHPYEKHHSTAKDASELAEQLGVQNLILYHTEDKNIVRRKELYTEDMQECESATVKTARNSMTQELDIIENKSINGVYLACVPVSGVITSRFGAVESIRDHTHMGIDIGANYGTPIKAVADGTITCAEEWGGYGNLVVIDHGNGVESYYGHCSKLYVTEGQKVKAGDVIAAVGSTGNSTGNHLHFELRNNGVQANPEKYVYKGQ